MPASTHFSHSRQLGISPVGPCLLGLSLLSLCLLALTGCGSPTVQERVSTTKRIAEAHPRLRVAVGSFTTQASISALLEDMEWTGLPPLMAEQIVTGLTQTRRVTVLERSQLDTIVANMELEKSEKADYFDQSTTTEKGKFLGAQVMLVGSITEFEPNVSGMDAGLSLGKHAEIKTHTDKAVVGIDVRFVEQETGRVLYAAHAQGEVLTAKFDANARYKNVGVGTSAWSRTPLGVATRDAADKAIAQLVDAMKLIPWEAPVLGGNGDRIFIGAGEAANLRIGDRFKLLRRGEAITDMDGNPIGFDETEMGWVEVQLVQEKMSIARRLTSTGATHPVKKGDVVRLPLTE